MLEIKEIMMKEKLLQIYLKNLFGIKFLVKMKVIGQY
jgi:hypothetical protein